jgi:hypothetical protein
MERALTTLEMKALSGNVGREGSKFLVCAVCPSGKQGVEYFNIDRTIFCNDRDHISKSKKQLKERFPEDEIKVLVSKTRRIE